jgi:hypothetical protein
LDNLEQREGKGQIGAICVLIDVVEAFKALDKLLSELRRQDAVAGMVVVHERT